MNINKKIFLLVVFILIFFLVLIVFSGCFMSKKDTFIVEIDRSSTYSNDIQVNYNSINASSGYHTMNRLQTLLYNGQIYEMQAQDSQFYEYYIKNGNKYFYKGIENLHYAPKGSLIRVNDSGLGDDYKLVITPTKDKVIFSNYKNGIKIYSNDFDYKESTNKNIFNEPIDIKLFTKFSYPKTSKFEPYLSEADLVFIKNSSIDDFKNQGSRYILERYVKNLNLSKEEIEELRRLELIRNE